LSISPRSWVWEINPHYFNDAREARLEVDGGTLVLSGYIATVPFLGNRKMLKNFLRSQRGATAIEYGLIAALIAVAIISGVSAVGSKLSTSFDTVQTNLK
jgi:pilus assembly protein Flp/PilA